MLSAQVTIRDIPSSEALEAHINEKAQKLSHYFQRILACHVVVEVSQKHKHQGKLYTVRIELSVPGKELVVNRKEDEDIYIAIREAFKAMERQIEKYAQIRRGDVKNHMENISYGHIARIFPTDGYGFIQGNDGNEFYFNALNVAHISFEKLNVGDVVQFHAQPSNDGLQAHRVVLEKSI